MAQLPRLPELIGRIPESAKRLALPLGLAAVLGLIAVSWSQRWRAAQIRALEAERQRLTANYQEPVPVVVAAGDIKEGTRLEAAHLKLAPVPPRFIQPYAVQAPEELVGLVTVAPIAGGEQVLTNKVRRMDEVPVGQTLSSGIPPGKRAVTIEVDMISGVGGFVRPGDKVDVLWNVKWPQGGSDQPVTLTLFQDVPVLAVGAEMMGVPPPREGGGSGPAVVTLALDPQETALLLFARQNQGIQLSLRPKLETGEVQVPPTDLSTVMQKVINVMPQNAQQAAEEAPKREVEIYRGLERNVVVLPDSG